MDRAALSLKHESSHNTHTTTITTLGIVIGPMVLIMEYGCKTRIHVHGLIRCVNVLMYIGWL